ncbi:MAG: 50S ribosomal protein L9 [Rhodospirillales bacterium]|nr:50S ribosomal protein L9 [Alphaproteobacteria bacterium]MCB9986927.1 50S ribosomal protein L9 [Rhodospirillales bacterium]USO08298.1 MAG: 50S ribosomal protein L9 [Rhodospirillales bacterium]
MQVILLEKIDNLGSLGEEVRVRDGYARNYLLPQNKALRATESNRAYFQREKAALEANNAKKRDAAEKESKKLSGQHVTIIRQASEAGALYGSVSTRDIAEAATAGAGVHVERTHVVLHAPLKMLGLFPVTVALHPEVKVEVTVNIARTEEEAAIQKKTGKALVKTDEDEAPKAQPAAQADGEAQANVEANAETDEEQAA